MNTTTLETPKAQPRLDYPRIAPEVVSAMQALYEPVAQSGLEPALLELVKLRASHLNGCAFCIDMMCATRRSARTDERLHC